MWDNFNLSSFNWSESLSLDIIWPIFIILAVIGFYVYTEIRKRKLKKLKYEWTWLLKKTKVSHIARVYHSWNDDTRWYYEYRIESCDDNWVCYRSNSYKNIEYGWRTPEEMRRKYNDVIYDLNNKEVALKLINDNIIRLECELANDPWFFKKKSLKIELETMREYLNIANEWPIKPFVVIKDHKISEGDSIDVYVDPNKDRDYYFDLDFTNERV